MRSVVSYSREGGFAESPTAIAATEGKAVGIRVIVVGIGVLSGWHMEWSGAENFRDLRGITV